MRAAFYETTGSPDVIRAGELPTPEPGPGEVRVRVAVAAVNPIDTYIRSGAVTAQLPKPFIPGCDFAGAVDKLGPGVTGLAVGQRVWGSNQGLLGRQGTFAEFVCPAAGYVYPTPDGVGDDQAAACALVGITAHLGLFGCARLKAGETVFVHGGTGGVGAMVVQMAKAAGARVITTAGTDAKAEAARGLGADVAINYRTQDVPAAIREATAMQGVQVWYETQREPDLVTTVDLMAPRGRVVLMAGRQARPQFPVGPFYIKGLSLFGFAMFNATAEEQRASADDINRWLAAGKLRSLVGQTFPLAEAGAAHRLQEDNTLNKAGTLTGKILVRP
jgi:NADPH2:quinone reductase